MDTASRIRQLLLARGIQERAIRRELAELCGISFSAVAQWFDGNTKEITPKYLAKIAARWGTTMEWLVTGKGTMDANAPAIAVEIELDRLIGALFERQGEFTAEHFAAIEALIDDLRRRASARFQQGAKPSDKK
jgi:transcriptional regulator with XRE-family HTH domain